MFWPMLERNVGMRCINLAKNLMIEYNYSIFNNTYTKDDENG